MKNKEKKKYEEFKETIKPIKIIDKILTRAILVCIVIVLFVIILGVVGIIPWETSDEKHSEITRQECMNESIKIGEKFLYTKTKSCNYTRYQLLGISKDCITKSEFLANCGNDTDECIMYELYHYKKENHTYSRDVWEDITKEKETCEQVEVNEISLSDGCIVRWDNKSYKSGENVTATLECRYVSMHKDDLTIEWLDEYAECTGYNDIVNWRWNCENQPEGYVVTQEKTNPVNEKWTNCTFANVEKLEATKCITYKYEDYIVKVLD